MSLEKKKIVLGITGGIAAFKAASIASQLRKRGAEVKCIMTDHATKLITPLTMREISGNPVAVSMFDDVPEFNVEHIALARWADVFVIAPATADIIGKIANGIADDMLSTTVMATTAPVLIAPAMNTNMYLNPITQDNMAKLKKFGYHFIAPDSGHLACGIDGVGRLPEPDTIVDYIELLACRNDLLKGKKVIVTAGGTREPIDPVRFIGNHSSGRMGFAIAKAAVMAGAEVTLVAGTTDNLKTPVGLARRIDVGSTRDMKAAVDSYYDDCDLVIKAAAVADYRSAHPAENKIKKNDDTLTIEMAKNPDIPMAWASARPIRPWSALLPKRRTSSNTARRSSRRRTSTCSSLTTSVPKEPASKGRPTSPPCFSRTALWKNWKKWIKTNSLPSS